ncbi:MAG: hypothetical protein ACRDZ5_00155 [Acidimicrobiales bacterium]
MHFTRRHIQLVLGVLWLFDGALQLQPFMFTTGFATQVINPVAQGQPAFVADPVLWASGLIAAHHVLADAGFAGAQLVIGAGLLLRPFARAALAGSVTWALGVWYMGEGLGGITGGHASLLIGAPGAALLYAVLSAAAWPAKTSGKRAGRSRLLGMLGSQGSDVPPRAWVAFAWVVLWTGGALLRALPGQANTGAVRQTLLNTAHGAPAWLAAWNYAVASWVHNTGIGVIIAIVVVEVAVGAMAVKQGWPRLVAAGLGCSIALVQWVLGQGMGQIYTGQATDPSTGLLLVVLAAAVLATTPVPQRRVRLSMRLPERASTVRPVVAIGLDDGHLLMPGSRSPGVMPGSRSPGVMPGSRSPGVMPGPRSPGVMPRRQSPGESNLVRSTSRRSCSSR